MAGRAGGQPYPRLQKVSALPMSGDAQGESVAYEPVSALRMEACPGRPCDLTTGGPRGKEEGPRESLMNPGALMRNAGQRSLFPGDRLPAWMIIAPMDLGVIILGKE